MKLGPINNNYSCYNQLIEFYYQNKDRMFENIPLEIVDWFPANTCSMLGAILYLLQKNLNTINIDAGQATDILERNGFLAFFGHLKKFDRHQTTVSYQMLSPQDYRYFNGYVFEELLSKSDLPHMTNLLKKKIAESIYEIFVNAQIHSQTEKIFTCGQFFPKRNNIEFMITDIGIGFKESVNNRFGRKLNAIQAIDWAMKEGHTTKQDAPGGIGLALLMEFIHKNQGKIQVISKDGFWEMSRNGIESMLFQHEFPGTAVNIDIKTDDPVSYALLSEVYDIF